jgi:ABC-type transporter Mla MlaB component
MALFSKPKPPAKKHDPSKAEARGQPASPAVRPPSARDLATHATQSRPPERRPQDPAADISVAGASMIEWTPGQTAFEVAQANPGLCAVLENAALLFASGQAQPARTVLEEGVDNDHDTRLSPLAWLALFDILQRAGDKSAFDQLALKYVVQFERSAPAWEERAHPQIGPKATAGGFVAFTGKLTAAATAQFDVLRRAMSKPGAHVRVDLASVTAVDNDGARLLADVLAEARRRKYTLRLQHTEKLRPLVDAMRRKGKEAGDAVWVLALELLQWDNDRAAFEDRAVEYAVTFELSPPSWEPPELPKVDPSTAPESAAHPASADVDALAWSGAMTGSLTPQLATLSEFAQKKTVVVVDMAQVERVDFVCAGALLNAINRIEKQRRSVQIVGASPIVRALLLLIGISPRHFVKKSP